MTLEALVRRDRAITAGGLAALTLLAWVYLVASRHPMEMGSAMPMAEPWGPVDLLLTFLMWAVMMVAMMVPSAAPMILLFATVNRKRAAEGATPIPIAVFAAGYLVVWTAFSGLAAVAQWVLQAVAVVSPHTMTARPVAGGALLLAAGVYQLTPLKYACLARCQSPLGFLLAEWREGTRGAFEMGIRHGAYCVGCCWALMALLFVAGVMNLVWVAAIAGFVLVEKLVPAGRVVSWVAGVALLGGGAWVLRATLGG